ncbi:MAG: TIGR00266 family protein [Spirochaetales bacterium]|nr:TIGR00266 family protein [Spirochaetales bacterium]
MKAQIMGNPSFSHVRVDLAPGETVTAESGAMQSMSAELDMKAVTNGGFFSALGKRWFGGESFFVNRFTNNGSGTMRVTLSQDVPGDIIEMPMASGDVLSLQKGAYLAHTGDLKLKTAWAGFVSWFSGEGLIKLKVTAGGAGSLFFGAYGGILERQVEGDLKVDDGHLVAFDPALKLKVALAGGLFSSLFGGEGFVTRVTGSGRVYIQTRSIKGLASWLNPKFR